MPTANNKFDFFILIHDKQFLSMKRASKARRVQNSVSVVFVRGEA